MAIANMFGYGNLPEDQQRSIDAMTLAGMIAGALEQSRPVKGASHRPGIHNLAGLLQGGLSGMQSGMGNISSAQKLQAQNEALVQDAAYKKAISGVPTETTMDIGENAGYKVRKPRSMTEMLPDYVNAALSVGDVNKASKYANILKTMGGGEKEFNIPADVDTFLATNFKYDTPKDRMAALNMLRNPEVKQQFIEWKRQTATPYFNVIPTSEGMVTFNARTGKASENTGYKKPLPGEMVTAQQQLGTLKDTLGRVRDGFRGEYVGPLAGRAGTAQEYTTGLPKNQSAFYTNLEQIKNTLIYLMSGKQINESEYERLLKQLPDRNLPESVFISRMEEFDKTLNSIIQERQRAMGGYGVPGESGKQNDPLGLR